MAHGLFLCPPSAGPADISPTRSGFPSSLPAEFRAQSHTSNIHACKSRRGGRRSRVVQGNRLARSTRKRAAAFIAESLRHTAATLRTRWVFRLTASSSDINCRGTPHVSVSHARQHCAHGNAQRARYYISVFLSTPTHVVKILVDERVDPAACFAHRAAQDLPVKVPGHAQDNTFERERHAAPLSRAHTRTSATHKAATTARNDAASGCPPRAGRRGMGVRAGRERPAGYACKTGAEVAGGLPHAAPPWRSADMRAPGPLPRFHGRRHAPGASARQRAGRGMSTASMRAEPWGCQPADTPGGGRGA